MVGYLETVFSMEEFINMGTQEIETAYPLLQKQFVVHNKGYMLRLTNPSRKGLPDYLLTHKLCGSVFVEVKCVNAPINFIGLEHHQAKILDELHFNGTNVRVICYCLYKQVWGIFLPFKEYKYRYKLLRFMMADIYTPEINPGILMRGEGNELAYNSN